MSSPALGLADVVGPEEGISCPEGTTRSNGHCGTICIAPPCTTDAECDASELCALVPYCVEELTCGRGGVITRAVRDVCEGGCSAGTCAELRTCFDADRVEPDGMVRPVNVTYGCGCRVDAHDSAPLALGAALLAFVAWRRRR